MKSNRAAPRSPNFLVELERQCANATVLRDETRAKILLGVGRILSTKGYQRAMIREVCEGMDISRAAFYQYFNNKTEAIAEILDGFCDFIYRHSVGVGRGRSDFERIYEVTRFYIEIYSENKGLFAAQYKLAEEDSAYSNGWTALQEKWRDRLARYILRATRAKPESYDHALPLSYMLTSMANDFLYRLIFENDAKIRWLRKHPSNVAAMISVVWYRAIFGRDPEAQDVKGRIDLTYSGVLPIIR